MNQQLSSRRAYRGQSPEQRRAERRARLLAGALAVYGERGYQQATVKAVCEAAGLTERYFYESFANSEALLIDAYLAVTYRMLGEILRAGEAAGACRTARARAMLRAYFKALQRDPRSARVFLVEIRGVSRAVDQAFDASLRTVGNEVARLLAHEMLKDELLQAGVIGGVIHIALRWIEAGYRPPIDTVVATALRLGAALPAPPRGRRPRA